jgi:16S rRNA processing protein RimM
MSHSNASSSDKFLKANSMPQKENKQIGIKSIARRDFITIGTIDKTHGTKGEMRISITSGKPIKEWAFLEIQGKPVPFYVQSLHATFDDDALLKLKDVDSVESASAYVGMTILQLRGKRSKSDLHAEDDFTGFTLFDVHLGPIGIVEAIEEYPNQLLIRTRYLGTEVLIPAVEAFITEIDETKRTIFLQLPDGLLAI